jgi:dethiobiotin synthetase
VALLGALRELGCRTVAMKPVASGSARTHEGLRNVDALALQAAATVEVSYGHVNPYCFEPPIAPHIAAEQAGVAVEIGVIERCAERLLGVADLLLVEGVGGWRVPLGPALEVGDLARHLQLPVLLVVGLRLGCINHALLSAAAIRQDGPGLYGWVANGIDPLYSTTAETVQALADRIGVPPMATLAWHGARSSPPASTAFRAAAKHLYPKSQ